MKTFSRLVPLAIALFALPALAEVPDNVARIEVLPGWRTAQGQQFAGLKITLAPGWKTYWRAPGDAGIPPIFSWSGTQNVAGVGLHWPTPEVFDLNGMRTIGYHDGVVIPLEMTPGSSGDAIHLQGSVELGVCQDICVPVALSFDGELDAGASRDAELVAALVDQPVSGADAGAGQVTCKTDPSRDGLQVTLGIDLPPQGGDEVVIIEAGNARIWTSEAETTRQGNQLTAVAEMVPIDGKAFALDRSALRVTVLGQNGAVDLQGCVGG